ncbi:DUF1611 domain-containing protein [Candidatus Marinimicrobia bacterium MT.SAG.3]|nr:DUF1611 domain-containing protein [Candidatus Marinimicrobia bacterium MT.SAG.3]
MTTEELTARYAILAEGSFNPRDSKTANAVLRFIPEAAAALIDSTQAGKTAQQVIGYGGDTPIVSSFQETLKYSPNRLLIGIAPIGGELPDEWRIIVLDAIGEELDIVSGLHTFLSDDEEFKLAASANNVKIIDLRKPPTDLVVSEDRWRERSSYVLLTVGTDVAIGKMTTLIQLMDFLRASTLNSVFIATGQTGLLLTDKGVCVDAVVSDFIAGSIESEIMKVDNDFDLQLVEGQGSLFHQGYSGVTLGLIHGSMPDGLLICHEPSRKVNDYGTPLPTLTEAIDLHKAVMKPFREVDIIGVSLYTAELSEDKALTAIKEAEEETGLPADDPVRFGSAKLGNAILNTVGSEK